MTHLEATDLTTRILECFNGPPGHVWEEELERLDAGRAGTALMRARREHENRWLSVKAFLDFYRSVQTTDGGTKKPDCPHCDGTGWIPGQPIVVNAGKANEYENSTCEPCACDEGRARAQSAVWRERGAA